MSYEGGPKRAESEPDGFAGLLDEMVRTGELIETLGEDGMQQFSLSGKGLLNAQLLTRRVSGQPDACRCQYILVPRAPEWLVAIHKPDENCQWHIDAVKRLAADTISDSDKPHALLFCYALDEKRCNICGKPAFRTVPGGTQECQACAEAQSFGGPKK